MNKINLNLLLIILVIFLSCEKDNAAPQEEINQPSIDETRLIEIDGNKDDINFQNVVKLISAKDSILIFNKGNSILEITDISLPNGFSANWLNAEISPNGSKYLTITFSPVEEVEYSGNIEFSSNTTGVSPSISLNGKGVSNIYEGDVQVLSQKELEDFIDKGYVQINGVFSIGDVSIASSYEVTDLTPLEKLISVRTLVIYYLTLESLEGIENLKIDGGWIDIAFNPNLKNLKGFPKNENSSLSVYLKGNKNLEEINDLDHLKLLKSLYIIGNEKLANLIGLDNLESIEGVLNIVDNILIENLTPLSNLLSVEGFVKINENTSLYDFCGLVPLISSDGVFGTFNQPKDNSFNPSESDIASGNCKLE
ncbi:Ig-like domain-containing protein [Aquimarina pacifica]|uniref:Ig-like domain-containing protein n=1 Tax=Aquimarina pacifica TaxID=1296415 RepID=UPI00046F9FAA|nr:hypothetical protein [Aquimarina pacifica]